MAVFALLEHIFNLLEQVGDENSSVRTIPDHSAQHTPGGDLCVRL